jgi:rfaE bifunctional protein nucleotidyltransferase chain/domain/rfaE bifunctional protein kinase chain/domain
VTARLVVVGDVLLDRDVDGSVTRIAPDAPAPVLDETSAADRPGGAGLAAMFAAAQGYEVTLITALSDDAGGARLAELLAAAGVEIHGLGCAGPTTEKIRLRADGRVLLRLDRGGADGEVPADPGAGALEALGTAAAVLVSDYGRGVARQPAVRAALADAGGPVVWDPHPRGPAAVPGCRLVTPNEAELRGLTGSRSGGRLAAAASGAEDLRGRWRAGAVAVTLGADGALLSHAAPAPLVVPPPVRADGDTCGAGDRFAVAAAAALAGGALVSEAVQEAVAQAAAYVAGGAVDTITAPQDTAPRDAMPTQVGAEAAGALAARVRADGGTVVATGGCFDLLHAGHVATLEAARGLGDCLIVCLNSDASIRALKGPDRPVVNQADRTRLLAALRCVDAVVVFDETTPHAVLSWLRPDIWVKGGDYSGDSYAGDDEEDTYLPDLPEAQLVSHWGGQTVLVPYLAGRSTTGMIAAARRGSNGKGAWR